MAVLVTGGGGYIGSHMVWQLLQAGEQVVVCDNLVTGFEWAIAPEAQFVNCDIGDLKQMMTVFDRHDIDSIIHFAGSAIVPESVEHPLKYYQNNTVKSRNLIEAAVINGATSFIFSSTAAVYGSPQNMPVGETMPLLPESPYGMSKMMTEVMLRDVSDAHKLRYGILRYFNVAGADPQGRTGQSTAGATHLIKVACEAALGKRDYLNVFGSDFNTPDGTAVRDYIHVTDLTDAHYEILQHLRAGNQSVTLNCGYGRGYSVLEVARAVKDVAGKEFPINITDRRAGDVATVVADNQRMSELLHWQPQHDDLHHIIDTALRWESMLEQRNIIQH